MSIVSGLWGSFNSVLTKKLVDAVPHVESQGMSLLIWPCVLIVINFIVNNGTFRCNTYIRARFAPVMINSILDHFLKGAINQSALFYQDRFSGKIAKDIGNLCDGIEKIMLDVVPSLLRGLAVIASALVAAYWVNPIFCVVLTIWFILFMGATIMLSKKVVRLNDVQAAAESVVVGEMVDALSNNSTIRSFAGQEHESKRIIPFLQRQEHAYRATHMYVLLMESIQGLLVASMIGFSLYFLIVLYGKNLVTTGDFALISGLIMHTAHVIWYTSSYVEQWNKALGRCKQSLSSLIQPNEIEDQPAAPPLVCAKGEIVWNHVSFQYKASRAPLFHDQSLVIPGGQRIGLVGYSGGGKSSFVNLIMRLYDVSDGSIAIDGHDIRQVTQKSLHQAIALIPQEPILFQRSLMENIRYGRPGATKQDVIDAAKAANAHDFIQNLPQGYDSMVGERGIKLSGGQRQRIAIARALLKDAPILIMDEATSQLDSVTEQLIQGRLWALMDRPTRVIDTPNMQATETPAEADHRALKTTQSGSSKTILVIAHRLSTLLHMDRILVFDQGKIIQDGPHQTLVAQDGVYQALWNAQIDGFLGDGFLGDGFLEDSTGSAGAV